MASSTKKKKQAKQGAPEKLKVAEIVPAVLAARGLVTVAAKNLGVAPSTIRSYRKKYKKVQTAFEEAKEAQRDFTEGQLFLKIKGGNMQAIKYYLSTQAVDRGYNPQLELAKALAALKDNNTEEGMMEFIEAIDKLIGASE